MVIWGIHGSGYLKLSAFWSAGSSLISPAWGIARYPGKGCWKYEADSCWEGVMFGAHFCRAFQLQSTKLLASTFFLNFLAFLLIAVLWKGDLLPWSVTECKVMCKISVSGEFLSFLSLCVCEETRMFPNFSWNTISNHLALQAEIGFTLTFFDQK